MQDSPQRQPVGRHVGLLLQEQHRAVVLEEHQRGLLGELQDHKRAAQPGVRPGRQRHHPQRHVRLLGCAEQVL
jgi:hypothetical protein